jgi:hypothetical protein
MLSECPTHFHLFKIVVSLEFHVLPIYLYKVYGKYVAFTDLNAIQKLYYHYRE